MQVPDDQMEGQSKMKQHEHGQRDGGSYGIPVGTKERADGVVGAGAEECHYIQVIRNKFSKEVLASTIEKIQ